MPTLQFVSCAENEKDKAFAVQHACFLTNCSNEMLHERWRRLRYAEFNVPTRGKIAVSQLCRERQSLLRTASLFSTKVIFDDFCRGISRHQCLAVNESWIRLSVLSSMCQHCSLSAAQRMRETKFFPYSILVFRPIVRIKC